MKILPIVLSNRQTHFKNIQKQTVNNTTNQNATTNSIYNNSKASFVTRNLAFCVFYDMSTEEQLKYIKKLEETLRENRATEEDINTLNSNMIIMRNKPEAQLAIVNLFEKYPDFAKQGYQPPIIESIKNSVSPEAQQAIIKLFDKYPELMQVKDNDDFTALGLAAYNFKTAENQLALIELFKKYPELATTTNKDNGATPLHLAAESFSTPESQKAIIKFFEENLEFAKLKDKCGKTPLHYYATDNINTSQGQIAIIDLLDKHPELAKIAGPYNTTLLVCVLAKFKLYRKYQKNKIKDSNEPLIERKFIELFKKHPEMFEVNGKKILRLAATRFNSPETQVALVEIFRQNFELAKDSDEYGHSALYEALANFKTPEGQRAIITLLYEHPEIVY